MIFTSDLEAETKFVLFQTKFLSIKNKIKLYKALIRPVLAVLKHGYY